MNRALISLYVLLTTPIPVPWVLLAKGAALVIAYVIARPFEQTIGIDALNISVLAGVLVIIWCQLPNAIRQGEANGLSTTALVTHVTLLLATAAFILFAPSPAWLQHAVSLALAGYGMLYALMLAFDRTMFREFSWLARDWETGQENAARWMILRCFGMATANEFAIAQFTQAEWVVAYAALPIVFHALFYWTLIATHPYEDDV